VALALGTDTKWIDNVLSHHSLPGIAQERQGVLRRVSLEGVLQLAVGMVLIHELSVPAATAFRLAAAIGQEGHYRTPGGLNLQLDLTSFLADLENRLARAVEIAPVPRRGRPPSSKTGRL
jgi:hypothetical protein